MEAIFFPFSKLEIVLTNHHIRDMLVLISIRKHYREKKMSLNSGSLKKEEKIYIWASHKKSDIISFIAEIPDIK